MFSPPSSYGGHEPKSDGGGLVEFDERRHLIRSSSAMDAAAKGELIRPYGLVLVPRLTEVWRVSDLLRTLMLPPEPRGSEQQDPGEPRRFANGKTVLVHTFSCGLYPLDGVETNQPSGRHGKTLDGEECAVPLRIGHDWLQTLFSAHSLTTTFPS
jgi:hypothetical protein